MSEIRDGNMRVSVDDFGTAFPVREANRKRFLESVGMPTALATGVLAHGSEVAVVRDVSVPYFRDTDALVTDVSGISIGVTVADCVPVFFTDTKRRAIGVAHAGWRGLVDGVLEKTVEVMKSEYGSSPADIRASVGPRIRECHFAVGKDVADRFPAYCSVERREWMFVDLGRACTERLVGVGVARGNLIVSEECTYCSVGRYFSFRRDKPGVPEAALAAIALRAPDVLKYER